jgi:uncharacterized oligopeptide transporter (OPT) family protein
MFLPESYSCKARVTSRSFVRGDSAHAIPVGGTTIASGPSVSPALLGVGYVIGPKVAALNFSGAVLAWGVMVPMTIFFLGPLYAPEMAGPNLGGTRSPC